jgi:aspartate/tyrosine/aromatic aminotransferase
MMFDDIQPTPLFGANLVASLFRQDSRADKIDLGLGVYKNDSGNTPVMAAVKTAEARLVQHQTTKTYQGLLGDRQFCELMLNMVLGPKVDSSKIAVLQTPGGVAALSLCFQLIRAVRPEATVWISDPSWANHAPVIGHTGLKVSYFPYYNHADASLDFSGMCKSLTSAETGDIILLQASCHNPTGVDLSPQQWDRVIKICQDRGLVPVFDVAYQGFGLGLEEDVYGPRTALNQLPEIILTATCSKSFSVYRDRAGIAAVLCGSEEKASRTLSLMSRLANVTYAMPTDHPAAVVKEILSDPALYQTWLEELTAMQARTLNLRNALTKALEFSTQSDRFSYIEHNRGMFSLLPLNDHQIDNLREQYGIYLVKGGRINLAGLQISQIERFADAIASVLGSQKG